MNNEIIIPNRVCSLGLGLHTGLTGGQNGGGGGGGAAALTATLDYTGVADTADYVHPDSTEVTAANGHDVASGKYTQADSNTQASFIIQQSVLDLDGKAVVSVKFTGFTCGTGSSFACLFLSNDFTPGATTSTSTAAELTGYWMQIGSSGNVFVNLVKAGADTLLGTRSPSDLSNIELEMRVTIGGSSNTIQVFRNGVQVGADITDSDAGRPTTLPCAGFGMRNLLGSTCTFETFVGAEIQA